MYIKSGSCSRRQFIPWSHSKVSNPDHVPVGFSNSDHEPVDNPYPDHIPGGVPNPDHVPVGFSKSDHYPGRNPYPDQWSCSRLYSKPGSCSRKYFKPRSCTSRFFKSVSCSTSFPNPDHVPGGSPNNVFFELFFLHRYFIYCTTFVVAYFFANLESSKVCLAM